MPLAMAMWGQISSKLVQFTQQVVPFNSTHHHNCFIVIIIIIIVMSLSLGPSLMVLPFSVKRTASKDHVKSTCCVGLAQDLKRSSRTLLALPLFSHF